MAVVGLLTLSVLLMKNNTGGGDSHTSKVPTTTIKNENTLIPKKYLESYLGKFKVVNPGYSNRISFIIPEDDKFIGRHWYFSMFENKYTPVPDFESKFDFMTLSSPRRTIYEIGAHAGVFTLLACSRGFNSVAVEGNVEVVKWLRSNYIINDCPGTIIEALVGRENTYVHYDPNDIVPTETGPLVKMMTLNEVMISCDALILIVDVEHNEDSVLEHYQRIIDCQVPFLRIEVWTRLNGVNRPLDPRNWYKVISSHYDCFDSDLERKDNSFLAFNIDCRLRIM